VITVFAPSGIGEITAGANLADVVLAATAADPAGPLADGDIIVVTSKIVSKAEDRAVPAADREAAITAESTHTVARRGDTRIVRTRSGLTIAAAGVDNSNVARDQVLLLPADCDASAAALRAELQRRTGLRLGVVISDTAGRAWRVGQTDQAVGAAGVRVVADYAGQRDSYANVLQVTAMALADELAAAADLVKSKLGGRPVAVLRGLCELVVDGDQPAAELVREPGMDLFGFGSQESVLAAALAATGQLERYEELVALPPAARADALLGRCQLSDAAADLVRALLAVDLAATNARLVSG
jgi:coenzyme F420-0:L-glutamate ligase/coenzyme F420-1:gamma-L-glutamate ligase